MLSILWQSFLTNLQAGPGDEASNAKLHCNTPVLSVVRDVGGGRKVFFNQMVAQYASNAKEFARIMDGPASLDDFMVFGDGSSIDIAPLEYALTIMSDIAINVEWQARDVALLDNFLVMHARRKYDGPISSRRVYASLVL